MIKPLFLLCPNLPVLVQEMWPQTLLVYESPIPSFEILGSAGLDFRLSQRQGLCSLMCSVQPSPWRRPWEAVWVAVRSHLCSQHGCLFGLGSQQSTMREKHYSKRWFWVNSPFVFLHFLILNSTICPVLTTSLLTVARINKILFAKTFCKFKSPIHK